MILLKTEKEIGLIRESSRIVAEAFEMIGEYVVPGITTAELDAIVSTFIRARGGVPAFKGFMGYPANICVSIDDEVVHGLPGKRRLEARQIVSIDIGVKKGGYCGDGAMTFPVGPIPPAAKRLLAVTEASLYRGIEAARAGNRLSDLSQAIQQYVEAEGYSVVRDLVGHGIGRSMHEEPQVPNFGIPRPNPRFKRGMVLAIEPMVNMGSFEVYTKPDHWTIATRDASLSAHFEHTVLITDNGPCIMTTL
ncbi:MAG: type I methionyl aminopeptidase [Candidatus Latescibacteria bacterium]|nr:type I methionyl aminopeptidase [Candidatus Latescibacterota bacterium]